MVQDDYIQRLSFSEVNLDDPFFDSLKYSYLGFGEWFSRKVLDGECAYFAFDSRNNLIAMLYLKEESGHEEGVSPRMDFPRLKIGTFKVDFDHHRELESGCLQLLYANLPDPDRISFMSQCIKTKIPLRWLSC